jgi:hypothetical protein
VQVRTAAASSTRCTGSRRRTEGHSIPDDEVSGWYFRKGWQHVVTAPASELRLLASRLAPFATGTKRRRMPTSTSSGERSPLLRVLPAFTVLFALAAIGLAQAAGAMSCPLSCCSH